MARTLLTIRELSAQLGVPVETLRDWRKDHRGPPGFNLGGPRSALRYEQADVDAWVEERKAEERREHEVFLVRRGRR